MLICIPVTGCDDIRGGVITRIGRSFNFRISCEEGREGTNSSAIYWCDGNQWKLDGEALTPQCNQTEPTTTTTTTTSEGNQQTGWWF